MKYHIITYGCQMNVSDSERIAKVLESIGFKKSLNQNEANLIILNLCSIRQSAIDRARGKIKNLYSTTTTSTLNKGEENSKILLTGCILKKDKINFKKYCDGIFKIEELPKLPILLEKIGFKIKKNDKTKIKHYLEIIPKYESNISACVPIMNGCNNFCAYCVVPYVRGREISRPTKDILCEVKTLAQRGIKEIWLLGQNVNSYKPNFAKLLKNVNDVPGNFWIRFTSSHPKDLSDEMIKTFAKCKKVTPYFNLPIQSGDNKILEAMNRPYTVKKYKELIEKSRNAFKKYRDGIEKELALSTDVIVGFPCESKKQFQNSKKTLKDINVAFAYISRYSPRHQTTAFKLENDVSPAEKKQRERELVKIVEKNSLKFNKKFLNKIVDVLILKKKNDFYIGKTRHYQSIRITANVSSHSLIGEFIKAKVIKATMYGLEGKIQ
jgi:tRNA-2-methylthio-N6-dimethylallyladenosine synthase